MPAQASSDIEMQYQLKRKNYHLVMKLFLVTNFVFSSPSLILVLSWQYLLYSHNLLVNLSTNIYISHSHPATWYKYGLVILICIGYISFPLFGLLADVWIGRYKAVLIGIVLSFLLWIIIGIGFIVDTLAYPQPLFWTIFTVAYVTHFAGYTSFKANILQYSLDQVVGASADQLNTIIYWDIVSVPLVPICYYLLRCSLDSQYFNLAVYLISGLVVSLALVSHSLFEHKLENLTLIKNPIKLIVRVLCYARKHKHPENRSALTYWEEEAPSRLDLGKEKYGGPFTEEEVEDVKTFIRMLPLFTAIFGFTCGIDHNWVFTSDISFLSCFVFSGLGYYLFSILLLMLYLYLIRICCYNYIPSMLCRMGVGLFFAFVAVVLNAIVIKFSASNNIVMTVMLILPQLFNSIGFVLVQPTSLEFSIAQSPVHARGVMLGLWYAFWGFGYLITIIIKIPFQCESKYICTNFYYYLTKSVLVLINLVVFAILAKRYKYRVRENEVNIVQIVDDHYQKYMEQEEQYDRDRYND